MINSTNILLVSNEEKAAEQIVKLSARRELIVARLKEFRKAIKGLIRKEADYPDLEPYLKCKNENEVRTKAFERWLKMEDVKLSINPSLAHTVMDTPPAVNFVLSAWGGLIKSGDYFKYWSATKQDFKVLPVTDEEKKRIYLRNEVHLKQSVPRHVFDFANNQIETINYMNMYHHSNITPGILHTSALWLFQMTDSEGGRDKTGHPSWTYKLKKEMFYEPRKGYRAFDEN